MNFIRSNGSIVLIILICVAVSFSPVLQNDFLNWDDDSHVTENELVVNSGQANVLEIFKTRVNFG